MVDLKKWKQRNAAERVKAALTKPKEDRTNERLRRKFVRGGEKAAQAIASNKGRNPWIKSGYNGDVIVSPKLGRTVVPINGDEAIALAPSEATAFINDVIAATLAGQLDAELLAANEGAPAPKRRGRKPKAT